MAILVPSTLETTPTGIVNWNDIHTTNMQKINTRLGVLMSSFQVVGVPTIANTAALTGAALTDSTGGTANTTLVDVGVAYTQAAINDNFADVAAQTEANRVNALAIHTKQLEIMARLRGSSGVGLLGG